MQREEKERIQAKLHRAADAQRRAFSGNVYHEGIAQGLDNAAGLIGRIPCDGEEKADFMARKTGRWILVNDRNGQHSICEFCGEWKYHQKQKFCGECGAEMKGAEDGGGA